MNEAKARSTRAKEKTAWSKRFRKSRTKKKKSKSKDLREANRKHGIYGLEKAE